MVHFTLDKPLPSRGSAAALRDQLIEHLLRTLPPVGARFHSDHELTRLTNVSRPTVRRALDELSRGGWIERRHGSGTFIGPRVAMPLETHTDTAGTTGRRTVRLAVMIWLLGDLAHDWYAAGVIRGIDSVAEEHGIAIELLGDREGDVKSVSRRLMQTRPDVLAFTAPPPRHTLIIGEALRLNIPCTGTGMSLAPLGVSSACEDGTEGAARAVRYLVERGHRRIGLVATPYSTPWVFARRAGYLRGLESAGLEPDEGMVCWLADGSEHDAALATYLQRRRPTAVLLTNYGKLAHLAPLVRDGRVRVPHDLSVITFDQHPDRSQWLGGVQPTTVGLPLEAMGARLASMARRLAERRDVTTEFVPCDLLEGGSVARPAGG
jgi:DNA-binding LacI/PurR family transcriptional regulator